MTRERWALGEAAWGDHEPAPVDVSVGPWRFQLRGDELADLSFDGSPVVRSVRAVARDGDWNTVPTTVETVEVRPDGCDLGLSMRGLGADLDATLVVRADAGRLSVRLVATSRTEFRSNRVGLVVLHPPSVAGADLVVGTPDGGIRRTTFPVTVSPHQPAMDIRSLAWTHDGVATTATFEGDVFEMEDQRNWTDASYKTYSRPLALPFPVTVAAGAVIEQSITFEASRVGPSSHLPAGMDAAPPSVLDLSDTGLPVPTLTLGASTVPDAEFVLGALPEGVAGLLVELDTRTPSWRSALGRAVQEAGGLPLDVRIIADDVAAVREAVEAAAHVGPVARLGVFAGRGHVTEPDLWAALTDAAARRLPAAELVGGARSHFTELNREHHRLPADLPGITFAMTPQMHANERAQLVESIAVQGAVVRDAARIADGRPLRVGPITLRSRFNAVATSGPRVETDASLAAGYGAELVDGATDARQSSVAMEAWTVASFAAICAGAVAGGSQVADVAYFETTGPRGIRDRSGPYPVAHAIEAIASLARLRLITPAGEPPEGVWLVGGVRPDGSWRVLVASLADHPVSLVVRHGERELERTVAPYELAALDSAG
ncbi:hypothetical protein [Agromyces sp. Soil535]|uniref:hypothetical protein n=1 Tax=Agromyces sp. Soil535 TaxID=1736390 RepID=UPI000701336A|nr:hypothetical protein [Agromyces sp. Soil535]KRE31365.1 hypothetical protein ASG80_02640 [Agromyces sp. Soil535]